VTRYLVEVYVSRAGSNGLAAATERARSAAEAMAREGLRVQWLRTIFVPEDETCFHLYEAASADLVRRAAESAGVACQRVLEATEPGLPPNQGAVT
jgi:Protein of unknown function (DUF4242)